jgi:hypothetical protein
MARGILIAALMAGCYQPQIADCVDTCASSGACPDGLDCRVGFCRTPGATSTCVASDAAAIDAPMIDAVAIDAPMIDAAVVVDAPDATVVPDAASGCPPPPLPVGCSPMSAPPTPPACLVLCATTPGTTAASFASGSWRIAVTTDTIRLAAVMTVTGGQSIWIGVQQTVGAPMVGAGWRWITGAPLGFSAWTAGQPNDGDGVEDGLEQCAALTGSTWSDEPCTASRPFAIEPI